MSFYARHYLAALAVSQTCHRKFRQQWIRIAQELRRKAKEENRG